MAVFRPVATAAGRAKAAGTIEPAATTIDAFLAARGPRGVIGRRPQIIVHGVPVRAPFPDIPVHVIQAKRVGREAANGRGIGVAIAGR